MKDIANEYRLHFIASAVNPFQSIPLVNLISTLLKLIGGTFNGSLFNATWTSSGKWLVY